MESGGTRRRVSEALEALPLLLGMKPNNEENKKNKRMNRESSICSKPS